MQGYVDPQALKTDPLEQISLTNPIVLAWTMMEMFMF
jgi:hypothetical protein